MTDTYSKKVKYLGSTGTQSIDTGLKGKQSLDIEIGVKFNSTSSTQYLLGNISGSGSLAFQLNGSTLSYFYGEDVYQTVQVIQTGTDYVIKAHFYSGEQYVDINGTASTPTTESGTFETAGNLLLFGINLFGTPWGISCDMSYCKIWDNNTLVRDFEPVLDNNNVPAMFDNVNQTLYYNTGTGDFTYTEFPEPKTNKKLMRKKLALMLATLKKKRKYYCEVEYLESTGTQYIDTGIIPTSQTGFDLCGKDLDYTASNTRLGSRDSATSNNLTFVAISTNNFRFSYGTGSTATVEYVFNTQKLAKRVSFSSTTKVCTVEFNDGTVESSTPMTGGTPPSGNRNILLFAFDNGTGVYCATSMKVRSFKILQGSTLVRDLIPVLDWDMTPCMYDKVSGKLFYNQGTGNFTAGREIHPVEYLESTGTQYINTGFVPTNTSGLKIKHTICSNNSLNNILIGVRQTAGDTRFWINIDWAASQYKRIEWGFNSYTNSNNGVNIYVLDNSKVGKTITTTLNYMNDRNGTIDDHDYSNGLIRTSTLASFTRPVYLFCTNNQGEEGYFTSCKVFSLTMTEGTTVVKDFIPAIDENGVGFMFDRVTHTCFLNQGTGAFKYPAREIEYLESTGTQYIDTGYAFTDNFSWEIAFDGIEKGKSLFGGRTSSVRTAILYQKSAAQGVQTTCPIAGMTGDQTPFQLADLSSGRHTVKMSVASNKGSVWVDGSQVYNEQAFTGTYISGTTQALFADNFGTSVSEYSSSKVYALKMWQGSNIVRGFIPCYKDGVAGMLDKQNNVFYGNVGTGTFSVGKVVEPEYES